MAGIGGIGLSAGQLAGTPGGRVVVGVTVEAVVVAGAVVAGGVVVAEGDAAVVAVVDAGGVTNGVGMEAAVVAGGVVCVDDAGLDDNGAAGVAVVVVVAGSGPAGADVAGCDDVVFGPVTIPVADPITATVDDAVTCAPTVEAGTEATGAGDANASTVVGVTDTGTTDPDASTGAVDD